MAANKRVYHPTLNAWEDVTATKPWTEAGWCSTKPDHIDDSGFPAPGEHPGFATIPVLSDDTAVVVEVKPEPATKAPKASDA